jgi:hypothetical protein
MKCEKVVIFDMMLFLYRYRNFFFFLTSPHKGRKILKFNPTSFYFILFFLMLIVD